MEFNLRRVARDTVDDKSLPAALLVLLTFPKGVEFLQSSVVSASLMTPMLHHHLMFCPHLLDIAFSISSIFVNACLRDKVPRELVLTPLFKNFFPNMSSLILGHLSWPGIYS
jgi:uncharacterized membrane protein